MAMYIRIFTKESSGKYEYDCIGELFIKRNDGGGLDCRIRDGARGRCGIANGEESAGSVDCWIHAGGVHCGIKDDSQDESGKSFVLADSEDCSADWLGGVSCNIPVPRDLYNNNIINIDGCGYWLTVHELSGWVKPPLLAPVLLSVPVFAAGILRMLEVLELWS